MTFKMVKEMKQKEQMHKIYYCKMDRHKTMFVEHKEMKGVWVCQQCRFITSNPKDKYYEPKKKKPMDKFWDEMAKKSKGKKLISVRSS